MEIINIEDDITEFKPRNTFCSKISKTINCTTVFNTIITIIGISILLLIIFLCRDYIRVLLFWIENQNPVVIFLVFILLFTLVSFPIIIGYLFLIIACGYLLGLFKGFFTVIVAANIGVAVAHNTIRILHRHYPLQVVSKNETARAILRVISGAQAFKVVLCTRLTPIPFGLQNTIFALSSVSAKRYHTATMLGLLPAQLINVYLGSTLRSMHDVLSDHHISITGYVIFVFQIIIGISVMLWVLCKARIELTQAIMQAESSGSLTPAVSSDLGSSSYRI